MSISEADVEAILNHGAVLRRQFRWVKPGKDRLKAECVIDDTYDSIRVRLFGCYNLRTKGLSYTIVAGGTRIRSLDYRGPQHQNPDGAWLSCPHKHKWTDQHQDQLVYVPTDITAEDRRGVLVQFLAECNIQFAGTYEDYYEQGVIL